MSARFSPQGTYLALWEPYAGKYRYPFLSLFPFLYSSPTPSIPLPLTLPLLSLPLSPSLPLCPSPSHPSSKGPSWTAQSNSLGHSLIRDGSGADTEETEWMV